MATAASVICPVCDLHVPCPTELSCLSKWGEVLLSLLPDGYRDDPGRRERMTYWELSDEE
jgi:hypothetical protein